VGNDRKMDPFPNHIATVEDYLRCYKTSPDKLRFFYCFTQYIVARAWKKMHRRIFSPYSLGYIYSLAKVGGTQLRAKFLAHSPSIPTPKGNDTKLASLLVGMQEEGQISSLIMDSCPSKEFRSQLTSLLSAFADVLKKKENKELSGVPEGTGVYTEATCYEFHQLLVASLMAYANALGALCKAERDLEEHRDMETMKTREDCTEKVWQCTYLLWRIACSHIFRQHLVLLRRGLWLHRPIDSQRELSAGELGLFTGLGDAAGKDGDEDAHPIVDEELQCIRQIYGRGQHSLSMFASWIHLQVDHWVALEVISSFSCKTCAAVKIRILVAELRGDSMEMDHWETTVRKLASPPRDPFTGQLGSSNIPMSPADVAFNPEVAIDILKQQINKYSTVKSSNIIFHAFTPKGENPNQSMPEFYGDAHCGAVLASFTKYANVATDPNARDGIGMGGLIQVLSA
jgi:hypothetical protein